MSSPKASQDKSSPETFFSKKTGFSWKSGTLVFANIYSVLARFWGSGTFGGLQKIRKNSTWKIMFFGIEKKGPKIRFLIILGSFLEPFWSSKINLKSSNSISLCFSLSGGLHGRFWDHFGLHFGVILVTFEVVLAVCSVLFPSRGLRWGSIGISPPNRICRTIFETWSRFFQLFFHLLAWSRPRRRRGRRPLQ